MCIRCLSSIQGIFSDRSDLDFAKFYTSTKAAGASGPSTAKFLAIIAQTKTLEPGDTLIARQQQEHSPRSLPKGQGHAVKSPGGAASQMGLATLLQAQT